MRDILSKLSGYRTHAVSVILFGLAAYQLRKGHVHQALSTLGIVAIAKK